MIWLPLRDADPVRLCLTQRQDSQPSRSAPAARLAGGEGGNGGPSLVRTPAPSVKVWV